MNRFLGTAILALMCVSMLVSAAVNDGLIQNGGMENAPPGKLPPQWEALNVGVPAQFASDTIEKHGGQSSIRINASEDARSYARSSEAIPVAPGEEIRASAWVKAHDVPSDHGTVIMIAEFSDADARPGSADSTVAKFDTLDTRTQQGKWVQISGSTKVPPGAGALRLRLGFSYAKGTCWWDDVSVRAVKPLVCRIDLADTRLSPALSALPVSILNRERREGQATLAMSLGKATSQMNVKLTGQPVQRVEIPLKVPKPGKSDLSIAMSVGGQEVFTDERKVTIPPPLVLSPPSPTHWCVEDGAPVIELRYEVALSDAQSKGAKIRFDVAKTDLHAVVDARNGTATATLKGSPISVGDYTIVAELRPGSGQPIRVELPWHVIPRRLAEVKLNAAGYPVYDGKAIFPLGIFNGGKFKEQSEAGFTVTHAYNAVRLEEDREHADQNASRFIDNTEANGMKMLFMIPMKAAIAGDYDSIRRRVRMFRNHPGLLAWDEEEGFARGDFKGDTLKKIRQIINEEDPHHLFMVGDARDAIGRIPKDRADLFPDAEMDMGMWWWYPLPFKQSTTGNALEGDEGPGGNEMVPPSFLVNAKSQKPIWVGVQSYKKKDQRYPTPLEYRSQAYIAIIHGAKGLMWYGGSVTGGLFLSPEEGHWDDLKKLARELRDLEPVLLSPSAPAPTISPAKAPVSACIRQSKDRTVLFAANRGASAIDVTIESPLIRGGSVKQHFEPYEVKIKDVN